MLLTLGLGGCASDGPPAELPPPDLDRPVARPGADGTTLRPPQRSLRTERPGRVERLVAGCNGCHGPGGRGSGAIPTLAGQSAARLAGLLGDWRTTPEADGRSHVMVRFARSLEAADIDAVAAWYAARDP